MFGRCVWRCCLFLFFFGLHAPAQAANVVLTPPGGVQLNSEYIKGDRARPALIVLHGFLQTYDFMSTQMIIDGLAGAGYAVLAPNLSLGIPDRRQSMQCEAAHKHTLADDLTEIDHWVDWLRRKGYRSVAIIGHSWGAQQALAYAEARPDVVIRAVIGVSLTRTSLPASVGASQAKQAQTLAAQASSRLQPYRLSFCKKYMGTAASYLSYQRWDDEKVVQTVAALHARGLPVAAVLGSEDKRIDARWSASLRQAGVALSVIEGANHFFSSAHEFELMEELERMLAKVKS